MNKLTPAAAVKEWCKRNNIIAKASDGMPMLSKHFPAGAMWIECFDSWKQAQAYLVEHNKDDGKAKPWSKPNYP